MTDRSLAPADVVRINGHRKVAAVRAENIYFTFESGRLDYDCVTCGARCCRGYGYNVAGGLELQAQLISKPALKMFLTESRTAGHDRSFLIRNCPPACFHLDDQGRCGIQLTQGYDAKPETCRFFPFNHFRLSDGYLVVAPHEWLCPLLVVSADTLSPRSNHSELLGSMRISGINASNLQEAQPVWSDTATLIQLERQILATARRYDEHQDYGSFARLQLAETCRMLSADAAGAASHDVDAYISMLRNVLGAVPTGSDEARELLRTTMSLTPTIRSHCVFRRAASNDLAPEIDTLPLLLLALHTLAAFARDAGMMRITYQTVLSLFREHRTLLQLLSWLDTVVVLRGDVRTDLTWTGSSEDHRRYIRILKALVPSRQERTREKLGDILAENLQGLDVGRIVQLNRLAARLVRRVTKTEPPVARGRLARVALTRAQHWALAKLPEEVLQKAGQRQRPGQTDVSLAVAGSAPA